MALVTFKDSLAEVGGAVQKVTLTVDIDGLVVGDFGKLPWADSDLLIEPQAKGCVLRVTAPSGGNSSFFVPGECFGSPDGIRQFALWLERGAASAGAVVRCATPA